MSVFGSQTGAPRSRALKRPGWPLTALLVLYPLWWALGLGTIAVFAFAVPMAVHLHRRRPVAVPPSFGLWLLFLLWVVASTVMLEVDPPGTLPGPAADRLVSVAFNLAGYVAVAVVLLYVGNLSEREYPRARLVRQLGALFVVVVAGGLLGTVYPEFQFTAPFELLLPKSMTDNLFVQSLVHPSASQLQDVLGYTSGRPSAPFGYTNTWGNALSLLLGYFAVGWLLAPSRRRRALGVVVLGAATVPIVYSLNRGLWLGLGLTVLFVVVRLAHRGRIGALLVTLTCSAIAVAILLTSPLMTTIQGRIDNPHSNNIRSFTIEKTIKVVGHSPVLGFGSTRRALGSSNSIAIGRTADCALCGNPVIGSNGDLWLLLVAQGVVGAVLYLSYFARTLWVYRHDRTPHGAAALLAVGLLFWYMLFYNAMVVPLLITFLSVGLLWRNEQARRLTDTATVDTPPPAASTEGPAWPAHQPVASG